MNEFRDLADSLLNEIGLAPSDVVDAGDFLECLGIPAATLSDLRSGEMVAVPRDRHEAAEEACREAWGWEYGDADPSTAALVRWHLLAAAKDARHD